MQNHPKHGSVKWIQEGHGAGKTCPMDRFVKMIGPAGQVVDVPLTNGWGIPRSRTMGYEATVLAAKARKGWLVYDDVDAKKREKIIEERKAKHIGKAESFNDSFKTHTERQTEVTQKGMEKMVETMANVSRKLEEKA